MTRTYSLLPFSLRWNPFAGDLPIDSLLPDADTERFLWWVEHCLVRDGGFALISGEPGTGKSVVLRLLAERLGRIDGLGVARLTHASARLPDFYRQLGDEFGVTLSMHNRWRGIKAMREIWFEHLSNTRMRPVLLVDEAQELPSVVLSELRLLAAAEFDSYAILSVVLAADDRLLVRMRNNSELAPLASRLRQRLFMEPASPEALERQLDHQLEQAGNPALMTEGLKNALCVHAAGNRRSLAILGDTLLTAAAERQLSQLDETLFNEVFAPQPQPRRRKRS